MWLKANINFRVSPADKLDAIQFVESVFREIREKRQSPAHLYPEKEFRLEVWTEQRKVSLDVYNVLVILRHWLSSNPDFKKQKIELNVPDQEKVWS